MKTTTTEKNYKTLLYEYQYFGKVNSYIHHADQNKRKMSEVE